MEIVVMQVEILIKAIGRMIKEMEKDNFVLLMEVIIEVTGKMVKKWNWKISSY